MMAANGAVVWSAKYSSFGKAEIEIQMVKNNLRFPGQYFNQETVLHYNWHRYFNPQVGRYLRLDPMGLGEKYFGVKLFGEQLDINLFAYVGNNPIYSLDNLGLNTYEVGKSCPSGYYPCPKKDNPNVPNGCGPSGWKSKIIPNKPFWMINFESACNTHDKCYGRCNADRDLCDIEFGQDMYKLCYDEYGINMVGKAPFIWKLRFNSCVDIAILYYEAVSKRGYKPWRDAQNAACDCCACSPG
jgi:RHS repeat-associated protein